MPLVDFPELQKLSRRAKNQLAEELWQAANANAPVSAAHRRTLDSRWADYKSGKTKAVSLTELKRRLDTK
ncbi:MAG: addiction module protein [Opitutaceae bacterium]|jgi:putative addiction module component (TIGR02574 family)